MSIHQRFADRDREHDPFAFMHYMDRERDARISRFHGVIGKRALKLASTFGKESVHRWSELDPYGLITIAVNTGLKSKLHIFDEFDEIVAARLNIVREVKTIKLMQTFGLGTALVKAANYTSSTGVGTVDFVSVEYIANGKDYVQEVGLNAYNFAEGTPYIAHGLSHTDLSMQSNISGFLGVFEQVERQVSS